jgi:hypothetical protein
MAIVDTSTNLLCSLIAASRARSSILAYLSGKSASFTVRLLAFRLARDSF